MTTRLWTVAGAAAALLWLVLGGGPAAVGMALLVTAAAPIFSANTVLPTPDFAEKTRGVEGIVAGGGALVALPAAVAVDEPAAAVGLVVVLAVVGLAFAVRGRRPRELPVLAVVGGALLGLALLTVRADEGAWQLPGADTLPAALAVAGAAAVLGASAWPGAAPWARVLVVPALVLGIPATAALPAGPSAVLLAVAAGAAARWAGPALALAALALLAATLDTGLPAAHLLAAAAVLATALVERGAAPAVLGLPGAAALVAAVAAGPLDVPSAAAVVALAAVTALLAMPRTEPDPDPDPEVDLPLVPVLVAGAWLLVLPGTWDWVGEARVEHWDAGALLAAVAGIATVVVRRRLPSLLERR